MTLKITTISIPTLNDIQHNDTKDFNISSKNTRHNDTQHKKIRQNMTEYDILSFMLSVASKPKMLSVVMLIIVASVGVLKFTQIINV
jgi:hypothetical protein